MDERNNDYYTEESEINYMEESDKKYKWIRTLIICIVIPLCVGLLSYLSTGGAMRAFDTMNKPPLSPPAWLFSVAWIILYILMGIGSFAIVTSKKKGKGVLIAVYGIQLFFNFLWSPVFFVGKLYWFALIWLLLMWAMIIYMIVKSSKVSKFAMICFIPYVVWTTFAAYLNLGIAILN